MSETFGLGLILAWLALVLLIICGWVMNIFTLIGMTLEGNEIEVIIRAVGIIAVPVGGVVGWF